MKPDIVFFGESLPERFKELNAEVCSDVAQQLMIVLVKDVNVTHLSVFVVDPICLQDLPQCDMLFVMGTSLNVHPFAGIPDKVNGVCPRLLINRDEVRVLLCYVFRRCLFVQ